MLTSDEKNTLEVNYCNTGLLASESTSAAIDQSVPQRCVFSGHAVVVFFASLPLGAFPQPFVSEAVPSRSVPVALAGRPLCILDQLPPLDTAPR